MLEPSHKVPATLSVGEMTTTDVSSKPSTEDSRTALPKKPRLAEGVSCTGSRDASQAQLAPPLLQSSERSKESLSEKVDPSGTDGHKVGPEEHMELEAGGWRRAATAAEPQTMAGTSVEPLQKVEAGRTSELSLEDLSISSRQQQQQQQLQASATTKVALATGGTDPGSLRRPNRKRKLLEDVESGKSLLLDAYRVWQQGQKVMTYDLGRVEKIMSETYMLIKQVTHVTLTPTTVRDPRSRACWGKRSGNQSGQITTALCSSVSPMNQSGQILAAASRNTFAVCSSLR